MDSPTPSAWKRLAVAIEAIAFVAILLVPPALRLAHPSLYADDVARVGELQEGRLLGVFLFTPFNEHLAPLFQAVSATVWNLAGRSLTASPLAFTLASCLPHLLTLILLGITVWRETKSPTTALIAAAMFGLCGLMTETFSWYSASSFSWAMLVTLAAIECAGRASGGSKFIWLLGTAILAFTAPAFSAIGLLAGPLALLRIGGNLRSLIPLGGTLGYLGLCVPFRYGSVVTQSLERNLDLPAALRNVACSPTEILLPGLLGRTLAVPEPLAMTISAALFVAVLVWAWRDRPSRPTILVGLGLIVGGYILAFGARSAEAPSGLRHVQRYQLFPLLGVVLLLAMVGRRFVAKFDDSALRIWSVGLLAAVAILALQLGTIREHARFYRWPDQAKTLKAIERLAATCRREGITRTQCLKSLDPIRNRWFDFEFNALILMPETTPTSRVADHEVRSILLGTLSTDDRESLFGGMDVSRYFQPADTSERAGIGRFVQAFEMTQVGRLDQNRWKASGWASFVEYEFAPGDLTGAKALAMPVNGPVEIWWAPDGRSWSESRSLRWRAPRTANEVDRAVPLDPLPHWDGRKVCRVRIAPRQAGEIAIGTPRLIR